MNQNSTKESYKHIIFVVSGISQISNSNANNSHTILLNILKELSKQINANFFDERHTFMYVTAPIKIEEKVQELFTGKKRKQTCSLSFIGHSHGSYVLINYLNNKKQIENITSLNGKKPFISFYSLGTSIIPDNPIKGINVEKHFINCNDFVNYLRIHNIFSKSNIKTILTENCKLNPKGNKNVDTSEDIITKDNILYCHDIYSLDNNCFNCFARKEITIIIYVDRNITDSVESHKISQKILLIIFELIKKTTSNTQASNGNSNKEKHNSINV